MSNPGLSRQQIDDYATQGYLRVGRVLDERQIAFLRTQYDQEIENAAHSGYIANLAAPDDADNFDGPQILQVSGVATLNLWFRRLVHSDTILDAVADLIGPDIRLLAADLLYKPPHHGSGVDWHRDNTHHQCVPATMVTGWLALDDVSTDNGAMQMLPGSHLRPPSDPIDAAAPPVDIPLPAGGLVLHHCLLQHRSTPNGSAQPRRAVAIRYVSLETRSPRLQTDAWEFFTHPIVRMRT